ncbi:hypothetical protein M404DRAFT_637412 [Pisolithus tinctorius Marx 270]|uniref:Uncharacterized protein n=1 Tax=Pisolithus tinctorius Marx 270 TaxID=870435 RepID=A0A0C3P5V2_PISTI|nr:hypothetical protein M404DRAFT_637412 [Pisolithus tinctorius Marx 270]
MDAYSAQKMKTDADEAKVQEALQKMTSLVEDINRSSQDGANRGLIDKERYVIPPHLHEFQEADLPEGQRGLVISTIAQFRERAAKREREKVREVRESIPHILSSTATTPSGPKMREWGKPQQQQASTSPGGKSQQLQGKGSQAYSNPVGFVKAEDAGAATGSLSTGLKTDEELEKERREARRRDEELSFKDVSPQIDSSCFDGRQLLFSESVDMNLESELVLQLSNGQLHDRTPSRKLKNVIG